MLLRHPSTTFEDKSAFSSFNLGNLGNLCKLSSNVFPRADTRKCSRRLILVMQQRGDDENSGKEPAETLFMKELRRRGISPTSKTDKNSADSLTGTESVTDGGEESDASTSKGDGSSEPTVERTSGSFTEQSQSNQRQRSMALNSEGLEGLIPRARALLMLGGSFFLSFWPLILSSLTVFVALYIYYGPMFIHSGNRVGGVQGEYVAPYELLNNERSPPEMDASRVPYNVREPDA